MGRKKENFVWTDMPPCLRPMYCLCLYVQTDFLYITHTMLILTFSISTNMRSITYSKIHIIKHNSKQVLNSYIFQHWSVILGETSRTKEYKCNRLIWVLIALTSFICLGLLYRYVRRSNKRNMLPSTLL